MRKIMTLLLVVTLSLTLVGCGGVNQGDPNASVEFEWNNGAMNFGGKDVPGLDQYTGMSANFTDINGTWMGKIEYAQDLTFMSLNSQGVEQMNMSTQGKLTYFLEYLDTQLTCCYPIGDDYWYVGQVTSTSLNPTVGLTTADTVFKNIVFTNGPTSCVMNDTLRVGDGFSQVTASTSHVGIPGLLKVTVGSHPICTNPYTFIEGKKEYSMLKGSADGYDVYQYGEFLIQTIAGYPIEDYIDVLK